MSSNSLYLDVRILLLCSYQNYKLCLKLNLPHHPGCTVGRRLTAGESVLGSFFLPFPLPEFVTLESWLLWGGEVLRGQERGNLFSDCCIYKRLFTFWAWQMFQAFSFFTFFSGKNQTPISCVLSTASAPQLLSFAASLSMKGKHPTEHKPSSPKTSSSQIPLFSTPQTLNTLLVLRGSGKIPPVQRHLCNIWTVAFCGM